MDLHILRNILITCVLLFVCVHISFQQNDYYDYDNIDDGLTPAPRRRQRPTPPPRRRDRGRDRSRGRDSESERRRQLEAERERRRLLEEERRREEELRRREIEARERERERERERQRERERYAQQTTLQPPPTSIDDPDPRPGTDTCGCPANIDYSINNLNEFATTSSETNRKTLDRLSKLEKQMEDFQELVERVSEESAKWKASLHFPGLTPIKGPTSITLTNEAIMSEDIFKDCQEVLDRGNSQRGVYQINPEGSAYSSLAFCQDGWTILQRRFDGSTDFYRPYDEYVEGFGNFSGEFWMGLEMMHQLTIQDPYDLRIDLESHAGKFYFAVYSKFVIKDEDDDYRLTYFNRTAGSGRDGLRKNKNRGFSAKDRDRDEWRSNSCARHYKSGFWLARCGSDLNRDPSKGIYGGTKWGSRYVKSSLMRIKPARSMRSKDYRATASR